MTKALANHPYTLVIHTNKYSGNFERELTAYVTGATPKIKGSLQGHAHRALEVAIEEMTDEYLLTEKEASACMASYASLVAFPNRSIPGCSRPNAISPTPGRSNNGMGKHSGVFKPLEERMYSDIPKGYPAYESVSIFFKKELSQEMQAVFAHRAVCFAKYVREKSPQYMSNNDFKILAVEYISRKPTLSIVRIPIDIEVLTHSLISTRLEP